MKLIKTETGQSAFKGRSPVFTVRQRSAFLLCDGKKEVAAVLAATSSMGVVQADLDHLVAQGFLVLVEDAVSPLPIAPPDGVAPPNPVEGVAEDRRLYVENWTMF